ncbi:MAG: drug/metabolite transporter (DMT)-like permease [Lentisphaeria bacterium]|jgi:drug/metabolite transporter (DMT)-like permease
MNNISLFLTSVLIWGSTWIMITYQLGTVEPMVSVVYRFSLASLILFTYCFIRGKRFRYSAQVHRLIFLQGILLFGFNYWLTYYGVTKIPSALAAILSTSIVYFSVIFARIFLKDAIRKEVIVGATIGVFGVVLIFLPELSFNDSVHKTWQGVGLILCGSMIASLGGIVSAKTQRLNVPVIQANALGMGYAAGFLAIVALISGREFHFEYSLTYVGSLVYLALFGSVLAFGAFLTLLGKIGPDKAGYVSLVYPVIAMIISTFFENYHWTLEGLLGLFCILIGNFIAMGKYRNLGAYRRFRQKTNN